MEIAPLFNLLCQRAVPDLRALLEDSLLARRLMIHDGIVVRDFYEENDLPRNAMLRDTDFQAGAAQKPEEYRDVISVQEAKDIFDALATMPDIPFKYPDAGCTGRAHMMCMHLFDEKIVPKKAWAVAGRRDGLSVSLPGLNAVKWDFHVAAAVGVRMPDGAVQEMVLDPSIFDGPVTLGDWGRAMHAPASGLEICPFGVAPKGYRGDYTLLTPTVAEHSDMTLDALKEFIPLQKDYPVIESGFDKVLAQAAPQPVRKTIARGPVRQGSPLPA